MEIMKYNIDGIDVEFVCESGDTTHGFKHTATMFENGFNVGSHTTYYLNRTWECFRYQTAMLGCIRTIQDDLVEFLKSKFKSEKGISRMTAKYKTEFEEMLKTNTKYNFYEELYKKVNRG